MITDLLSPFLKITILIFSRWLNNKLQGKGIKKIQASIQIKE